MTDLSEKTGVDTLLGPYAAYCLAVVKHKEPAGKCSVALDEVFPDNESPKSLLSMPQDYKYSMPGQSTKTKLARGAISRSRPYLLVFSAHNTGALKRNDIAHCKIAAKYNLLDLSFTLANHRTRFQNKGTVVTTLSTLQSTFSEDMPGFTIGKKNDTVEQFQKEYLWNPWC
ncbi:uncharacterized protein BKA55DRAFT_685978 [Fusarium redolens]|uniref:Uncharacterized protein n=1 Tax=Fusarium redolens TaxID=48865 RepID=A0A9P9KJQ8_FUSRE|nr:uncharacterized protein BKA55DRAFT_685978 [Fusarium redolens]KAH7265512.1 hypothetical protein BKA55DRAFT_685978 [Fusarium redolens]